MIGVQQAEPLVLATHPIIEPLVHRHAGDAAFYWQQHDGSAHSPLVGLPQLLEFDRLLDAHLDGLRGPRVMRGPRVRSCLLPSLSHRHHLENKGKTCLHAPKTARYFLSASIA